jgi:putative ABC transport system permease protein
MFLALAEIRRSKLRFALLSGSIGLLAYLILFQQALTGGLITQFVGAIRNQSGSILVLSEDARANLQASNLTPEQVNAIRQAPGVASADAVGLATFTASTEVSRKRKDAKTRLVETSLFGYQLGGLGAPTTLRSGRLPRAPGEVVASQLNTADGFSLGRSVRIEPSNQQLKIVGIAKDINFFAAPTLFGPYETYEATKRIVNPNARGVLATAVMVKPAKGISNNQLELNITNAATKVQVLTRSEAAAKAPGVSSVSSSFGLIIGLLWFVVLLTTGLFFLILTVQKTGSLTILRAMGASGSKLVSSLIIQVVLVMLVALLVAVGLFTATVPAVANLGLSADPSLIASTALLLLVVSLIGTGVGATRRVLRIDPASAVAPLGGLR